ncbi:MAG TPA: SRPBCC domain-containing protein [Acidobacteriaceae bacterium]|nr:SRPBCC domain-containing protein [Acidobacteriaceae bacterium]HUB00577.1 SRPBCC domain-containing protein [Terracidiphilus sp.]
MGTMTMAEIERNATLKVQIRRVIRAERQRVFDAWTNPEAMRKWMGPGMMSTVVVENDLRVGGSYRIVMQGTIDGNPEQSERRVSAEGVYTELVPNEAVSFTWRPTWNPEEESQVTVRLKDVEGGTEIVLLHERFATEESRNGHERGWTNTLPKLEGYLEL